MFVNVKMSLADLLGKKYTDRVVAANEALGVRSKEEALAIAEEKIFGRKGIL